MLYRRFGKTELAMPVFSCGGMRYQQSWQDIPFDQVTAESQANVEACIHRALELGINHIETARGYGCSEVQLGRVLPDLPRDQLIVQTKVGPGEDGDAFERVFDDSMRKLRLDHVDLLAIHGINNRELLELSLKPGGSLERCHRLCEQGRARFVGFSTHGPTDVIVDAIASDGFDYVNLHYYWADQANAAAVAAARARDMGVFIISPSEKGGLLFKPPAKLVELCAPLAPLAFNNAWTLSQPGVHTLSIGAARPSDFDAHVASLAAVEQGAGLVAPVAARLAAELERVLGAEWLAGWQVGLPRWEDTPGGVNLYHTLRLYNLAQALDMVDYGKMRYNLLGSGGHWFAGYKVDKAEWDKLSAVLAASPVAARIPEVLREAHAMLAGEDQKRLSESEG
jgi:predicted aldo/keto reductase-like oxidoreductase